jgi:hypothetical protein
MPLFAIEPLIPLERILASLDIYHCHMSTFRSVPEHAALALHMCSHVVCMQLFIAFQKVAPHHAPTKLLPDSFQSFSLGSQIRDCSLKWPYVFHAPC